MGYIEELRRLIGHRPLLLPGAVVILMNSDGKILLQKRKDPQNTWGLPGGLMELGESAERAAQREVREETGLIVGNLQLIWVYSGAETLAKAANGDCYYPVTIVYFTKNFEGTLRVADPSESETFAFMDAACPSVQLLKNHKKIIDYWFAQRKNNADQ